MAGGAWRFILFYFGSGGRREGEFTISMTCCCTMPSIIVVVSGATSAVSPETNIIWDFEVSKGLEFSADPKDLQFFF